MEYCIIASKYRTEKNHVHVFLDNLVTRLVDRGERCNVIAPQSIVRYLFKRKGRRPLVSRRYTENGNEYMVYSPLYFNLFFKFILGVRLFDLSKRFFTGAIWRAYRKYGLKADVVYSHFMLAGIGAVRLARRISKPSFIANGESDTIDSLKYTSKKVVEETLRGATGIISVSSKNRDEIKTICQDDPAIMRKVVVIPNAVDLNRFHPLNKQACRKQLGWPENDFIVSFTGSFSERKGSRRLSEALSKIPNVKGVFIGQGDMTPVGQNVLYQGCMDNAIIPIALNASDVFCLPTLAEGCCNAIIEAIACGVPVVSSDLPFNYDILDDTCSFLVDPKNVDQICDTIKRLKEDPACLERLHGGCLEKSRQLSLDYRVDRIQRFVAEMCDWGLKDNN